MKKIYFIAIAFVITVILLNSIDNSSIAENNEEMLIILNEEVNVTADIQEYGIVNSDKDLLFVGISGEMPQTYNYYAAHFTERNDGVYELVDIISFYRAGWQLRICKWRQGYVIVSNNENVELFQMNISQNGKIQRTEEVEILGNQFLYYVDISDIEGNYECEFLFLDEDGNQVK